MILLPFVRIPTHPFSGDVWRWVKGVEVFILQILDVAAAVPVASYFLETTREYQAVPKRVDKVFLFYIHFCENCFPHLVLTRLPQVFINSYKLLPISCCIRSTR